jgi:nitrite reductase/ring-hydroxylating ferredoxin subunit/putative sterol carrier protein
VNGRFPFPSYPTGWFVVAVSSDIAAGEVKTVHYFGQDIVLFRTASGVVSAVDKTCPHLGAHLGGGRVEGECLRCPFHGWGFDPDGRCVDVPYAPKIPPRARVRSWPVLEQNGVILVHYAADGSPPAWTPPVLDEEGWTANRHVRWEITSHPQEVGENTVDCAHLAPVHHVNSTVVRKVERNGHLMRVVLLLNASGHVIGMPHDVNDVELDVTLHGLGIIMSRTHVMTAGLKTRQRIHPTPIEGDRLAIFAVGNTWEMPDPDYTREIDDIFWAAFQLDFARDFPIWSSKAYLERPLLASGDGPIGAYRKWARQFYIKTQAREDVRSPASPRRAKLASRLEALKLDGEWLGRLRSGLKRVAGAVPIKLPLASDEAPRARPPEGAPLERGRRFETVDAYFQSLERRFDPSAAGDLEAVFQWSLSGDQQLHHFAEVRDGRIHTAAGVHASPTVAIEMSRDDYLRMINGDLNGALAFSTGRGKLRGPVRLAMRMQQLFPLERVIEPASPDAG